MDSKVAMQIMTKEEFDDYVTDRHWVPRALLRVQYRLHKLVIHP